MQIPSHLVKLCQSTPSTGPTKGKTIAPSDFKAPDASIPVIGGVFNADPVIGITGGWEKLTLVPTREPVTLGLNDSTNGGYVVERNGATYSGTYLQQNSMLGHVGLLSAPGDEFVGAVISQVAIDAKTGLVDGLMVSDPKTGELSVLTRSGVTVDWSTIRADVCE